MEQNVVFLKISQPIIDFLPQIKQSFLFYVTLTSYLSDIEPYVLDKNRTDWLHEFFHIITLPEWVRFILKCNVIAD